MRTGDKMKENKENKEEQAECWICKRGFTEALDEFNKRVLSSKYLDEDVKSRYEKGKKEFFPSAAADNFVEFVLANVQVNGLSLSGKVEGEIFIWLCPVCSGLLESISSFIDMDDIATKEELENASIKL